MYLPTVAIYGDLSFVLSCLSYNKRAQVLSFVVVEACEGMFYTLLCVLDGDEFG